MSWLGLSWVAPNSPPHWFTVLSATCLLPTEIGRMLLTNWKGGRHQQHHIGLVKILRKSVQALQNCHMVVCTGLVNVINGHVNLCGSVSNWISAIFGRSGMCLFFPTATILVSLDTIWWYQPHNRTAIWNQLIDIYHLYPHYQSINMGLLKSYGLVQIWNVSTWLVSIGSESMWFINKKCWIHNWKNISLCDVL